MSAYKYPTLISTAFVFGCAMFQLVAHRAAGQDGVETLLTATRHLRNAGPPEWAVFGTDAPEVLRVDFVSVGNATSFVLELVQEDVKQDWRVTVNGVPIGRLLEDEKAIRTYFSVPAGVVKPGENRLTIQSKATTPDDILIGDIRLHPQAIGTVMSAKVSVEIVDDKGKPLAGRVTVANQQQQLQTFLAEPDDNIAFRAGCLYTPHRATISLPPGTYVLYGGRGFEYGIDSVTLSLRPGETKNHRFVVRREVDTRGWVASDTHIHTYTHSGHGDATLRERMITLAGEGIELPVMTDHNIYVDASPVLDSVVAIHPQVKMTLVTGNELTTRVGHFNVFPIPKDAAVISPAADDWKAIQTSVDAIGGDRVVILNHARDVHNNFRPFGADRHLSRAGLDAEGWNLPANAMEVINSGSQQSDFMVLFHDWMGMLNGGRDLTPVGSSDSHDVNRYIVGQGRTYIRANDEGESGIDIAKAMRSLLKGKVMVSCGLLTKIAVDKNFGPGELARGKKKIRVAVDVLGPSWSNADSVALYMNGVKVREAPVIKRAGVPVHQRFQWRLDAPGHDVHLVALAHGRAGAVPFWPIAKPYQPASPVWVPRFYAASGAVWIDGDRNERKESAADYAVRLLAVHGGDYPTLINVLSSFDRAVSIQVAARLWKGGVDLRSDEIMSLLQRAAGHVKDGFEIVANETGSIVKR